MKKCDLCYVIPLTHDPRDLWHFTFCAHLCGLVVVRCVTDDDDGGANLRLQCFRSNVPLVEKLCGARCDLISAVGIE